ncbi:MAG: GntR family transcriptional regulator [Planctomycetota bacterium]|jgi:GntR family transcriptional regulator
MIKSPPKYIIVENKIREAIKHQKIIDKLPGERVLAKEFEVSYMTIRKAVENLVTDHVLYKVPARGTYVKQRKTLKGMIRNISGYFENRIA